MAPAPEFGKRQYRTPTQSPRQPAGNGSSGGAATLKLAAVGFIVAALAVGGWTALSVTERPAPFVSKAGSAGNGLDFSGDRVGRASTAPLLKVCIDMEPYFNGSDNELEPADILKILEAGKLQVRDDLLGEKVNQKAELSRALSWGGVADCTYRQDATRLCDIDNRALAVEAGSSLVRQADRMLAAGTAAPPGDLQSLRAIRDRVLDSLRRHVQGGVLVAADFSSFAPAAIRDVLKTTEPVRNDCAHQ